MSHGIGGGRSPFSSFQQDKRLTCKGLGGGGWWGMVSQHLAYHSAFLLSCSWVLWNLPRGRGYGGGRGGPHAPVIVLPGGQRLGSRPHVLLSSSTLLLQECNPECQLSICPRPAGIRAQHPASGSGAPAPLPAPASADPDSWTGGMSPTRASS